MTQQNPITPSPELRARWRQEAPRYRDGGVTREDWLIDSAAQWGLSQCGRLPVPAHFFGVPLIPPADCIDPQSWIAMRIYQMGADRELEACIDWMKRKGYWAPDGIAAPALRAARRPKPPSLKQEALEQLDGIRAALQAFHVGELVCDSIRRALEQLDD